MTGNVIQPNGASGVEIKEIENVNLHDQSWSASRVGAYYTQINDVIPANKKLISAVVYFWSDLSENNYNIIFTQSTSIPTSLILMCGTSTFDVYATISIRIAYV